MVAALLPVRRFGAAVVAEVRRALELLQYYTPEILLVLAWLGGWTLFTYGLAALLSPHVWPLSGGIFLLSLVGWRMLWAIMGRGLYALSKGNKR